MQTAQHWGAKAVDAEDVARAMAHSPDSFAMLEIARLYRQRAEQSRQLEKAGVRETTAHCPQSHSHIIRIGDGDGFAQLRDDITAT
jgi:hypothetical protein